MMKPRRSVVWTLLTLSVVIRLVPFALYKFGISIEPEASSYPWNFSPILPICIFGGAFYADRRLAYEIPCAAFLLADLGIWTLTGHPEWAFYKNQPVVYLSVALVVTTGFLVRNRRSWSRVAGAGLLSATAFFTVTNFGVWAFGEETVYPHTLTGLVDCYVRALPYFRSTLISMAVFLPLLFSRVALADTSPKAAGHLAAQRG